MRTSKIYGTEYRISDDGTVWSPFLLRNLTPTADSSGYLFCIIRTDQGQKTVYLHKEVWKHFAADNRIWGLVTHKDGNKANNSIDNLRCTHDPFKYIELIKRGVTITRIAEYFGHPKKEISKYVSMVHEGGIRDLRKKHPMNKSLRIEEL